MGVKGKPLQSENFEIQKIDAEYQLVRQEDDQAIFINEQAIMVWQLCDGSRTVQSIKNLLSAAYPDAAKEIKRDVDDVMEMLLKHGAVTIK